MNQRQARSNLIRGFSGISARGLDVKVLLALAVAVLAGGCGSFGNATATFAGAPIATLNVNVTGSIGSGGAGGDVPTVNFAVTNDGPDISASDPAFTAYVGLAGSVPQTGAFTSANALGALTELTIVSPSSSWREEFHWA